MSSTAFYPNIAKCFMTFGKVIFSVFCFPAHLPCNYQRAVSKPFSSWLCFGNFSAQTWHPLALKQPDCACTVSTHITKLALWLRRRELCLWTDRWQRPWCKSMPTERLSETRTPHTLLLYCLEQWGQHTGGVAMVPVSWVWVLSMGSGSPGPAGRSFRMLGGSSAPGWFFRMCALRLLALLYTCRVKIWN